MLLSSRMMNCTPISSCHAPAVTRSTPHAAPRIRRETTIFCLSWSNLLTDTSLAPGDQRSPRLRQGLGVAMCFPLASGLGLSSGYRRFDGNHSSQRSVSHTPEGKFQTGVNRSQRSCAGPELMVRLVGLERQVQRNLKQRHDEK